MHSWNRVRRNEDSIKEFPARRDPTQSQLADLICASREAVSFIEQGTYNPSLRLAPSISLALESSIDELFIFDDGEDIGAISE